MVNPQTIDGVVWTFTSITLAFIITRIAWRTFSKTFGIDDAAIIISTCVLVPASVLLTLALQPGREQVNATILLLAASTVGILSFSVPKVAIALLLIRILTVKKWQKYFLLGLTISCLCTSTANAIWVWFPCNPPAAGFNPQAYPNAKCADPKVFGDNSYFTGSYSGFVDFFLAVFPATQFWSLQMPLRRKIILSIMLGLGLVASVVAFYKCQYLKPLQKGKDPESVAYLLMWTNVEANVVHIAACLPTLPKFAVLVAQRFRHVYGTLISSKRHTNFTKTDNYLTAASDQQVMTQVKGSHQPDIEMQRLTTNASRDGDTMIMKKVDMETTLSNHDDW